MDHGEVGTERLGWLAWLLGRIAEPRIVREADLDAAVGSLPVGATILNADPNGNYVVYEMPSGEPRIRFRASAAWLPNEPTAIPNNTPIMSASITRDGQVLVMEGLHRARAMARDKVMIAPKLGGVEEAPGWLDFPHDPVGAKLSQSSLDRSGPWRLVAAK
jgi:hypothetical protein